jgi:hypothetical protein
MFNIPGYKGNANQNNTDISPYSSQNVYHEYNQQQIIAKILGKKHPYTCLLEI